jgi:hypothetical protein
LALIRVLISVNTRDCKSFVDKRLGVVVGTEMI